MAVQTQLPNGHQDFVKLDYTIYDSSGHSSSYVPENIIDDRPTDQSSRWSSLTNDQNQFLMLKLDRPALVRSVTFGKFFKTHVCNLKEFKVLAGSTVNNLFEVAHTGLRNDSDAETFPFSFRQEGFKYCPIMFVKIVPMAAWGNNFNFSIWHVELRGLGDLSLVKMANGIFQEGQRQAAFRLCLKFLKGESGVEPLLPSLKEAAGLEPEAPLLRSLYELTVLRGDFDGAEGLLRDVLRGQPGLFDEYIEERIPYECIWERLDDEMSDGQIPSRRGGHQMVWDPVSCRLYVLGGWDGSQDLADFWMWEEANRSWTCISADTRLENGPGPRSCHKVCLAPNRRLLFVLGRFVEADSRTGVAASAQANELFQYDLEAHVWTMLCRDVAAEGGPSLLYDHQMAVDEARGLVYVFGGRVIGGPVGAEGEAQYSGLYVWSMDTNQWRCLRKDAPEEQPARTPALRARIGHSMVFDSTGNRLVIFAGQRHKDYLADYYVYDVASDTVVELEKDTSRLGGPDPGFTQRATLDEERGELYLFTGLMRERPTATASSASSILVSGEGTGSIPKNTFWVYTMPKHKWTRLDEAIIWPCPRFAHQLAYDAASKTHYLFGGNPGEPGAPKRRLNDFWRLTLRRPLASEDVLRRAAFLLRRQHYYELCVKRTGASQMEALKFLQNQVSACVLHTDPAESDEFRTLSAWLFQPSSTAQDREDFLSPSARSPVIGLESCLAKPGQQASLARRQLFDELAALLPCSMRPPAGSLLDLV